MGNREWGMEKCARRTVLHPDPHSPFPIPRFKRKGPGGNPPGPRPRLRVCIAALVDALPQSKPLPNTCSADGCVPGLTGGSGAPVAPDSIAPMSSAPAAGRALRL